MKKLISLFITLAITTLVCMNTAMAFFVMNDGETAHNHMMQDDMPLLGMNIDETMQLDCEDIVHTCCFSPFSDSGTVSGTYFSNEKKEGIKGKNLDISFFALLQKKGEANWMEKIHSPPVGEKNFQISHFYITLTGSTKNNC